MGAIDRISGWAGKGVGWLIPVLILELVYDTAARYVFSAPTFWSYDISYMLYGTVFMIGSAHTLALNRHVRIELIYDRLSERGRAVIDLLGYLLFYFPAVIALLVFGSRFALQAWRMGETSGESMWSPPISPFKTVIPLAALLLLLQGLAQFMRSLKVLRSGE